MFFNLRWIWSKKTSASSFYQENNFKPCLTKQLLNMFKLWCERGIRSASVIGSSVIYCQSDLSHKRQDHSSSFAHAAWLTNCPSSVPFPQVSEYIVLISGQGRVGYDSQSVMGEIFAPVHFHFQSLTANISTHWKWYVQEVRSSDAERNLEWHPY